jgi:hypothetical protein
MRPIRVALLAVMFCAVFSPRLWAWGCTGHEVVALIALHNLKTLDAANGTSVTGQVEKLLATQSRTYANRYCDDFGLDPIAYFATWADDHRTVDPSTAPWHFWDIPLRIASGKAGEYCDQGCVIQALQQQITILQDKSADPTGRVNALMYVIHFIGDMHQPLHEEDNNDRGGNCVPVTFGTTVPRATGGGNYSPNLHAIWDTQLVEHIGDVNRNSIHAKSQIEAFASSLQTQYAATINQEISSPADLVAWANQAHAIAIAYPYTKLNPAIAAAPQTLPVNSCSDNQTSEGYLERHETVNLAYITAVRSQVKGQLAKAGARLAAVLYSALK